MFSMSNIAANQSPFKLLSAFNITPLHFESYLSF